MRSSTDCLFPRLRIVIKMSPAAHAKWVELVEKKRSEYSEVLGTKIGNESEFKKLVRKLVKDAPKLKTETDVEFDITNIVRAHREIKKLATNLSDATDISLAEPLLALIWTVCFAVLQACPPTTGVYINTDWKYTERNFKWREPQKHCRMHKRP